MPHTCGKDTRVLLGLSEGREILDFPRRFFFLWGNIEGRGKYWMSSRFNALRTFVLGLFLVRTCFITQLVWIRGFVTIPCLVGPSLVICFLTVLVRDWFIFVIVRLLNVVVFKATLSTFSGCCPIVNIRVIRINPLKPSSIRRRLVRSWMLPPVSSSPEIRWARFSLSSVPLSFFGVSSSCSRSNVSSRSVGSSMWWSSEPLCPQAVSTVQMSKYACNPWINPLTFFDTTSIHAVARSVLTWNKVGRLFINKGLVSTFVGS